MSTIEIESRNTYCLLDISVWRVLLLVHMLCMSMVECWNYGGGGGGYYNGRLKCDI